MLNSNKRQIVSIAVTILIILGTYLTGYADITPVSDRTPQVRDAIVTAAGVNSAADVTEAHLAGIGQLTLDRKNIAALKEGDFDGLTSLDRLSIGGNPFSSLPENIFSDLTSITWIQLGENQISSLPADVFSGLTSLTYLILPANKLSSLPAGIFTGLSSLQYISLWENQLTSLPAGLFSGLSSLREIHLKSNQISSLPADVFSGLSSLTTIRLGSNQISSLPTGVFSGLSSLTTIELGWNQLNNLSAGLFTGLSSLTKIELYGNQLTTLPTGLFSGLSSLDSISLYRNQLSSLPMGIFSGLSSLTTLNLSDNAPELSLIIELQQVGVNQFKAVIAAGAPFTIVVPLNVTNGSIMGGVTTATIPIGSVESTPFTVIPTPGTSDAATVLIGTLPDLPSDHSGYTLAPFNLAPVFVDGPSTIRTVAEDIHTGGYIGTAVSATDPYNDPLTYTLSGADASLFAIDATTGQLRTSIQLDYETRSTYTVNVNVTDGTLNDSITVTINVTDVEPEALNVGEPRTVRLFYFLPNDRPYRQEVVDAMKTGILEVQSFYAEQMAAHGHGNTTFTIETDAQGDPIVHRINADYGDSHYVNRGYTEGEIARAFDTSSSISVIVMDVSHYRASGQGTGNKSNGWLMIFEDWDWFTAAHELAHACGLHHDFRDDTDILSYGRTDRSTSTLSAYAAEFLSVHPYFNSSIPLEIGTRPTVELVSPPTYPAGAESTTIRVRLRDDSGLHQAILFVRPNNPFRGGTPELKLWQKLDGQTDTTVEFNFDGRVPSDSDSDGTDPETDSTLANTNQHEIRIMAVDTEGNWFSYNFTLEAEEAQRIVPVSERTPQIRDAIVSAVPGVNNAADVTEAHLAAITHLRLSGGNNFTCKEGDLVGLFALTSVHFSGSEGVTISEGAFSNLPALTSVYFSDSEGVTISEGAFSNLPALTYVFIYSSEGVTISEGAFSNLPALTSVDFSVSEGMTISGGAFSNLPALTSVDFSGLEGVTISGGAFSNLPALTRLDLRGSLTAIPDRIFEGLTTLTQLLLGYDTDDPLPITVSLEQVVDGQFKAMVPTGAPFEMVLPIRVTDGSISGGASTLTIPAGSVESEVLTVTRTPGATYATTVYIGTIPSLPANHTGYTFVKSVDLPLAFPELGGQVFTSVGSRTPQVAEAILGVVRLNDPNVSSFSEITYTHLTGITALYLNGRNITSLKSGDFEGLTALEELRLYGNQISSLPEDIFEGLTVLEELNLYSNQITNLPEDIFSGLTALTTLTLYGNQLTTLPPGIFNGLSSLSTLRFGLNQLTTLPADLFDGLTSLTDLRMVGNQFSELPDGIFVGLTGLTTLSLGSNAVNPLPLTVTLEKVGTDQFKAVAPTGAPFDIVLPLSVTYGSISGSATTLTIPAGSIESEVLTVTRTPDTTGAVTVNIGTLPSLPSNHGGYTLVKSADLPLSYALPEVHTLIGIRTPQVRDAIVAAVPGINNAVDVTEVHLAAITALNLNSKGITALKSGDFADLTSLTRLVLDSNQLTTLPSGIFDGLTLLTWLDLGPNRFTTLPSDIFDGLTALSTLDLSNNRFITLPSDIFDGLTALRTLALHYNRLTTLPMGIFAELSSLNLGLYENQLTILPDGLFSGLSSLTSINLSRNAVDPLALTVSLVKVGTDQFKAVAPAGAPFDIVLPISVTDGSISGGATTLTIPAGSVESEVLSVTRTIGTSGAVSVWIGSLPSLPASHTGYSFANATSGSNRLIIFDDTSEQIWSGTITVGSWGNAFGNGNATGYGYDSRNNAGSISNPTFTYRGTTYTIHGVGSSYIGNKIIQQFILTIAPAFPSCDKMRLSFIGVPLSNAGTGGTHEGYSTYIWYGPGGTVIPRSVGYQSNLRLNLKPTAPDAPTVTATNEGNQVTLSYATPCDGGKDLSRHEYRQKTRSGTFGSWIPIPNSGAGAVNVASYTLTNVSNPQDIVYEVRAVNELGAGATSAPVSSSDRTPQVAEAILEAVRSSDPSVTSYADITGPHLAAITTLNVRLLGVIITLKANDFEGLASLEELNLWGSRNLTALPDGIFKGLTSLTRLQIYPLFDSKPITVSLEKVGTDQFKAVAPTGAPFDIVLPLALTNGRVSGGATTLTIPTGSVESDVLTVTRTPDTTGAVTVHIGTLPSLPSDHGGYTLVKSADLPLSYALPEVHSLIGNRTPQVRDAIIAAVPDVNSAADVTAAHLAAIRSLTLSNQSITSLKDGDFDGLTTLKELFLHENSIIDISPLAGLTSLTWLDLAYNDITDISPLAGLTSLTTLSLQVNSSIIDISPLAGLTSLTTLDLSDNSLTDISALAGLTSLITLELDRNSLIDISPLAGLTALTTLDIDSNSLTDISPLKDLTALTNLYLASNSIIDISPLKDMTALTWLRLSSNSIIDISPLKDMTALRLLSLSSNNITDISALELMTSLTSLGLASNSISDYAPLRRLIAAIEADGRSLDLDITIPSLLAGHTPAVRDAIVAAVPGVNSANGVTEAHLAAITILNLQSKSITSLKSGDFEGLTALEELRLYSNQISSLPADIFDGLSALRMLNLFNNRLSSIPDGLFEGLTSLTTLRLNGNAVNPMPFTVSLIKVGTEQIKAATPTGAPFDIVLPISVSNGSISGGVTSLTIPTGSLESDVFTVTRTPGVTFAVSADIGTLPGIPTNHLGYTLVKSADLPIEVISEAIPIVLVDKGVCKVGDILTLGESCTYPDTDAVFSVIADGRSQWNIPGLPEWLATFVNRISINNSMSITSTVYGKTYRFEAKAVENDSWKIEQIGDRTQESIALGINIPDANLRAKIEAALSKSSGDTITVTEMETLTSLNGQDSSISDLTGLETATNLTTLKLGDNTISDISALTSLTSLTELQLWDNQISTLSNLSGLTNLTTLYLWGNNVSDISDLSGLTSLTHLRLGENNISNISTVSNLTNLTQLYLNENSITDISAVAGLTSLTELVIGSNTISDITPVQNLTNLEWLDIPNNSISDISAVQNLTLVVELYFQNNSVSDLSPLVGNTGFGEFTEIDMRGNPLSYPSIYTHIPALQAKDVYIDFDNRVATVPVKISGDTQQGETNATLTQPFVVEVKDSGSVVFAGVPVTFAVTAGGGTLSATNTTTDVNGRAQTTLTLGNTAGTNTVRVSVPGVTQTITFTATATAPIVVYITPVGDRTSQVATALLGVVRLDYPSVSTYTEITATHLASPTALFLNNKSITALKSGDFDGLTNLEELRLTNNQLTSLPSDIFFGLTSLSNLNLFNNQLSSLPDGIFEGLTSLKTIRLGRNTVDPLPVTVSLEKVVEGQFKAVAPTGAPFAIVLPISVTNGSITGGVSSVTIPQGSIESDTLTVTRTAGTTPDVTVDIGTLPGLPRNHYGYTLVKSDDLPLAVITSINTAPVFTDGTAITRTVPENTAAATNIGTPIAATDTENDTLTYTLGGTDASAFDIDSSTGQLKTKAPLDYETKSTYTLTITVSDGSLTGTITVTINVTDIDEAITVDPPTTNIAPEFLEGASTTRVVSENTPADTNIGNPVNATDTNNDTLRYSLGGVDAASFDIDNTTGQLKTKTSLDYETKRIYSVTITAADDELSDTITVIISIIDVNDTVVSAGFVPVADRTPQVRDAIVAAVPNITDAAAVTESQVAAITRLNLRSKGISSLKTGDFSGMTALTNLNLFRNQLTELPPGIFDGLTALTTLRIGGNVVDPLPLIVSLQSAGTGEFKAVITTGAPFSMVLPITVTNGSISGGITSVTIPQGSAESTSFTVIGSSAKVSFGTLPGLPANHFGYTFAQSNVCNRTTEVADAIAAAVGVSDCSDVTEVDLATITTLDISNVSLASLNSGDFSGMLSLTTLYLDNNDLTSLPSGVFDGLVSLRELFLNSNKLTTLPSGIFSNLTSLINLYLFTNDLSSLPNDVFDGLTSLKHIGLEENQLTSLPSGIFDGIPNVNSILVSNNNLTSLPAGIFEGLTQLSQLHLSWNPNPNSLMSLTVSLQKVGTNQFKAVILTGAPFAMELPVTVQNGTIAGGANTITIPTGNVESQTLSVARTRGTVNAVTVNIGTPLPTLPATHNGYALVKSDTLPLEVLPPLNSPPVFTEGASTTRTIAENITAGTNIGDAITATDVNIGDTLTYTLGGTDAAVFDIDSTTGQLKTKAALDFETKNAYSVTLTVSDSIATDAIGVTINISNVNEAPIFAAGSPITQTVAENTAAGENIGTAYSATDVDGDTLTYSLSGQDAAAFGIDTATGQLKTSAALDYETKTIYSVTINVSDSSLTDTITVIINVTDVDELPAIIPVCQVGNVLEPGQSCTYPGTDIEFTVNNSGSGNFLFFTSGNSINIKSSVINGKRYTLVAKKQSDNSWKIEEVGTSAANNVPVFTDGETATRTVVEDTPSGVDIGTAVSATDDDGHTLTYTLGGTDADKFSIDSTNGQLRTEAPLDYETKSTYTVTITANDGTDDTTITVTINVINKTENRAPVFSDGTSTSRSVAEDAGSGVDFGSPVAATDADGDNLTYTLGGTDAASFSIDSITGQLRTNVFFDYETKTTYTVTITVSDGSLADSITVTINITDVEETPDNSAPVFNEGSSASRSVNENTGSGADIGNAVSATDDDGGTLSYSLSGTDASSFSIDSSSGQIRTSASLNYETQSSYTLTVNVSDGNGGSDSITVTINISNINEAPVFTNGTSTTRSIAENSPANTNIGTAVAATDPDDDTLIYTLSGTDAATFSIDAATGQLKTSTNLDFETKNTYSVTIAVSDGSLTDTITVTINVTDLDETPSNIAPVFTEGNTANRSVAENTNSGLNIGTPVSATDEDSTTLAYLLSGTDAAAFSIVSATGQLQTSAALNFETKSSYTVTITVNDGSLTDEITVTINVTNVNEAPVFTDGVSTSRSVVENTAAGTNIGAIIAATDPDVNTTLTYTLGGTDAASFDIVSTSGQLQTSAALDYESKTSYSVTITVSDGALTDSISVTITVTDVDENRAPSFTEGTSTSRSIAENTGSGQNIGNTVSATDPDIGDTLIYTLGGTDAASFSINSTNGQLRTSAALDYETKTSYSVTITVSDGTLTDSISVTITVTDVDENRAPSFTEGPTATRSVAENTGSGQNIGNAVSAMDPDAGDTLNYTLGGTDTSSFSINSTNGQLRTSAALDYESKTSYSVIVSVSDGNGGSDSIDVTINVTDVDENRAPTFTEGPSTSRSIAENTGSGQNIGNAVSATDPDASDTLNYTLGGTDAASFDIVSTSGQLQTKAALDYETKSSYSVTVSVSDGNGGTDSITVTINVTDVTEPTYPLYGRTQQVQDAIVAAAGVNSAADVTAAHLAAITNLNLSSKSITSLKTGDFDGLTALTTLNLNLNSLSDISALEGLTNLTSLSLSGNSVSDISALEDLTNLTTLHLSWNSVSDISALEGLTNLTNLQLHYNSLSDISALEGLTNLTTLSLFNNSVSDISALEGLTNLGVLILFNNSVSDISALENLTNLGVLSLYNNSISDISALENLTNLRNLLLSGNSISDYGPLRRLVAAIEAAGSSLDLDITIPDETDNNAPEFTDGASTTRSIAENTASGTNIGSAVSATDADNDTLAYTLGGTDASSFSIVNTSGQLQTSAALDYETKTSYSIIVSVSDGNSGTDSITVTINVTDVDEATIDPPLSERTQQVRDAIVRAVPGVSSAADVTAAHLAAITTLRISVYSITSLKTGDFDGLTALTELYLDRNSISDISALEDLTNLTTLELQTNNISDISALSGLTKLDFLNLYSNSISDISALSGLTNLTYLSLAGNSISNISVLEDLTNLTYLSLGGNSISNISVLEGLTNLTELYLYDSDISDISVLEDLTNLTYLSLGGNSISDISVVSGMTNLTNLALSDNSISDISAVSGLTNLILLWLANNSISDISAIENLTNLWDLRLAGNSISDYGPLRRLLANGSLIWLDIRPPDNNAPEFTDGTSTTRSVAENTASGQNIGDEVSATDADNDTLAYTLGGTDASSFSIVSTSGQLQTSAALDYETKTSYTVTVSVSDGNDGTDSITVTINVTDVTENTNNAPVFTDGTSTTRSVAENTASGENIGDAVSATDSDNDTLAYTLGGTDASSFSIVSTSGQLQTSAALDYETKTSYTVTISVSDGNDGTDSITVTINVTDVTENTNNAPVFTDGTSTTRSVAENTASGENIGDAVSATDSDNDTLTYTLGGTDASSFSIVSTSGQLQTSAALDYETKTSYTVTVSVSDGNDGTDSITVTINVTDVTENTNNAPVFTDGTSTTRSIAENTAFGENIGDAVSATDADNDTLAYTLGGTDASSFSIVSTSGQLQTSAALDYETQTSYSVTVSVSDGNGGTDSITVTINVTDVTETLSTTTTYNVNDDIGTLPSGTWIPDRLSGASFQLVGGQVTITFNNEGLIEEGDYTYTCVDAGGCEIVNGQVTQGTIEESETTETPTNNAPVFTDGTSTTRSVAENTASGENIGDAVSATDADNDTLAYTLGGTDASSFSIVSTSGQLQTSAALDYETKTSYTVTVSVSDGNDGSDSITVTINVTDVSEGTTTTFNVGDTIPGFSLGGTWTFGTTFSDGGTEYTCVSDGQCTITNGVVTQGTIEGPSNNGAPGETSPPKSALLPNFPNPFNPETWIPYQLSKSADVTLTIYNMRGVVVRQLKLGQKPAGVYLSRSRAIHWDGRNSIGEKVAAGVYFYTLTAGDFAATRKMLIRK